MTEPAPGPAASPSSQRPSLSSNLSNPSNPSISYSSTPTRIPSTPQAQRPGPLPLPISSPSDVFYASASGSTPGGESPSAPPGPAAAAAPALGLWSNSPTTHSQNQGSGSKSALLSDVRRRMSLDTRRVRSDVHPRARQRSITVGKRPSVVTGGYESSSEDGDDGDDEPQLGQPGRARSRSMRQGDSDGVRPQRGYSISAMGTAHAGHAPSLHAGPGHAGHAGHTGHALAGATAGASAGLPGTGARHRDRDVHPHPHAHSPVHALPHAHSFAPGHGLAHGLTAAGTASPISPAALEGLGIMSAHPSGTRRRAQSLISPSADYSPPTPGRRGSRPIRSPLSATHTPRNVTGSGILSPIADRSSESRDPREAKEAREAREAREPRDRDRERSASMRSSRHDDLAVPTLSLPSSHAQSREGSIRDGGPGGGASHRKQKIREPAQPRKRFGASLGLGAAPREVVLSPDQLQNLLQNVDVSTAIQRMSAPPLRRVSTVNRDPSPSRRDTLVPPSPTPDRDLPSYQSSPPQITKPFLVSAPPALTSGDWSGRIRSDSNASSTEPPMSRNITPMTGTPSRIRTSSLTSIPDREHDSSLAIPAVSPIPAGASDEDEAFDLGSFGANTGADATRGADANGQHHTGPPGDDLPPPRDDEIQPLIDRDMNGVSPVPSSASHHPKETSSSGKRRISGLFGTIRRKRDSSPPPQLTLARHASRAPTPEKPSREQEMRMAEIERREEELVQERMYRVAVQVRNYPNSQRRAQRAALLLDGYYAAIHDGLENPPKFNPLAVLRWMKKTEEQKAARAKWEAETEVASRASGSLTALSRSDSVNSPQSDAFRISLDAARRAKSPQAQSVGSAPEPIVAPGWHYTLEDVAAYNACGGKVDYFIPVINTDTPLYPDTPGIAESKPPSFTNLASFADQKRPSLSWSADGDLSGRDISPVESRNRELGVRDMVKDDHLTVPYSAPHSSMHYPVDSSMDEENLSRTPSFDISRSFNALRRHRGHQSTTGIPAPSQPAQPTRKTTLERLGGRRNISLSASPHATAAVMDEGPRGPGWLAADVPIPVESVPVSPSAELQVLPVHTSLKDRVRRGVSNVANRARPDGTSDEEHAGIRKRFAASVRGRLLRAGHLLADLPADLPSPSTSRVEVMRHLEDIVGLERQVRYEVTDSRQPTAREIKAQQDLNLLETQIYDEREVLLADARRRVDDIAVSEMEMTKVIEQFLVALDQAQATFHTAADVEVEFPNLDELRLPPKVEPVAADDESADSVAPLRGEESDRGAFSAGGTWSDSRSGRPTQRARKMSLVSNTPSLGFVYGSYNRRSIVDPTLGEPIDPMRRTELSCARARDTIHEMMSEREDTTRTLQGMVETINQLIAQKDRVRRWTTRTLDQIAQLKDERDTLRLKIRGGIRPRMARVADSGIDLAARCVLAIASVGFRLYRLVTGRGGESWLPWALCAGVLAGVLGYFYMVGEGGEVPEPLVTS